jgi:hypothetical protein
MHLGSRKQTLSAPQIVPDTSHSPRCSCISKANLDVAGECRPLFVGTCCTRTTADVSLFNIVASAFSARGFASHTSRNKPRIGSNHLGLLSCACGSRLKHSCWPPDHFRHAAHAHLPRMKGEIHLHPAIHQVYFRHLYIPTGVSTRTPECVN